MAEDQSELFGMHLDYQGGHTLKETVRWPRFLSVVGIIGLGMLVLALLVVGASISPVVIQYLGMDSEVLAGLAILIMLITFAVLTAMVVMLYRFSVLTRRGIAQQDQETFNSGLNSLRIYFLISGILGILSLLSTVYNTIVSLIR